MTRDERGAVASGGGAGGGLSGDGPAPPASSAAASAAGQSHLYMLLFWVPLAAQWIMMALEGPFLAAVIARAGDPAVNLAAFGVAFAFAILVESPVIMLMSASTALVEDSESYRKLRNFANVLNAGSTALLLLLLVPPVYATITASLLGLPEPVANLVYGALWLLLPWPAAIGYRRFLHGVLIRSGRTRQVAYGTMLRLAGMSGTAVLLFLDGRLPGAWIGAAALSAGVCVEALAARFMAAVAVRELLSGGPAVGAGAAATGTDTAAAAGVAATETSSVAEAGAGAEVVVGAEAKIRGMPAAHSPARSHPKPSDPNLTVQGPPSLALPGAPSLAAPGYGEIASFYYPLALTSLIALTVHPMLTFFMGRAASPLESLAVFPVVHGLSFLFRAPGFAFQEVVIALAGRRFENVGRLVWFGTAMALATSAGLALVAFTPLATVWFETVSGLPPALAERAVEPARILVPLPAMAVLLAFQQGMLVLGRTTRAITWATVLELIGIAILFTIFGWRLGIFGASAAMLALIGGRLMGNLFLLRPVRRGIRSVRRA